MLEFVLSVYVARGPYCLSFECLWGSNFMVDSSGNLKMVEALFIFVYSICFLAGSKGRVWDL